MSNSVVKRKGVAGSATIACLQKPHLTALGGSVYSALTAAKSAVGATTSINQKAYSRFIENVAFFVPGINWHDGSPSLWALLGAEPAQAGEGRHLFGAGKLADGCGNSFQCPPFSITTEVLGCNNSTKKVPIMADSIFTLREDVTPSQLSTYLHGSTIQSIALCDAIGEQLSYKPALQDNDTFSRVNGLQWALLELLQQQLVVSDGLEGMQIQRSVQTAPVPKQGLFKRAQVWLLGDRCVSQERAGEVA